MTTLRNKGGDYRRSNGEIVKAGATFTPGEQELLVIEQGRRIGIRFEVVGQSATTESRDAALQALADAGAAVTTKTMVNNVPPARKKLTLQDWPKKMPPEQYVRQWPDGPQADLARRVVADLA